MTNHFKNLSRHDVVYIREDKSSRGKLPSTSRVEQLIEKIKAINWQYEDGSILSEDGIECEILQPDAQGWQKGIVRVSVEFLPIPEVVESENLPENNGQAIPENPLDVIRQEALQNNL
jgi:KGK domain